MSGGTGNFVAGQPIQCTTRPLDPEDPLFILYTAGAGGKPRGILHTHGGFCVEPAFTMAWVFDIKDTDVYWCTADIGWITGHSYIAYGPLCSARLLASCTRDLPTLTMSRSLMMEARP